MCIRDSGARAGRAELSAAYTVIVMDLLSDTEAEGLRVSASWHANDALAGYGPPESAKRAAQRPAMSWTETRRDRRRDEASFSTVVDLSDAVRTPAAAGSPDSL